VVFPSGVGTSIAATAWRSTLPPYLFWIGFGLSAVLSSKWMACHEWSEMLPTFVYEPISFD